MKNRCLKHFLLCQMWYISRYGVYFVCDLFEHNGTNGAIWWFLSLHLECMFFAKNTNYFFPVVYSPPLIIKLVCEWWMEIRCCLCGFFCLFSMSSKFISTKHLIRIFVNETISRAIPKKKTHTIRTQKWGTLTRISFIKDRQQNRTLSFIKHRQQKKIFCFIQLRGLMII